MELYIQEVLFKVQTILKAFLGPTCNYHVLPNYCLVGTTQTKYVEVLV